MKKIFFIFILVSFVYLKLIYSANSLDFFNGNFFEGFEDNNLSVNNWTTSGAGTPWEISAEPSPGPASGTYYLSVGYAGAESIVETSISTQDYTGIVFSFNYTSDGNDDGEYLAADWYNGTGWINVFYNDTDWMNNWQMANFSLPSQASNNPNFKIRFRALSSNPNEDFYIDDINIIGNAGPQIGILYPKNNSIYNIKSLFLRVNITGNSLSSCWYDLNGVNTTYTCGTEPVIVALEGTNNLTAYVNNTINLIGEQFINFNVNSSIPLMIDITSPTNNTISTATTPQIKLLGYDSLYSLINYTLYIYHENGTLYSLGNNGTLINGTETEITLSPALTLIGNLTNYNILVNATDDGGNLATNSIRYTVTLPAVTLVSPEDDYWDADGNLSFSFKVLDEAYSTINCSLYLDGILNQTNGTTLSDNTLTTFDVTGISEGANKTWEIVCVDASNNTGSDSRTFHVDKISLNLTDFYGMNSSLGRVDGINTTNLEEIEYFEFNFSLSSIGTIDSWHFNFTANGTNGCSLGNKQSNICYSYPNWIQFINGTDSSTYDGAGGNIGDRIIVTQTGSGNNINVSLRIDEHYNPNVFKWYNALYNFSDVKWQNDTYKIKSNNTFIKVELNQSIIPLDADQYKLDFRVQHNNPEQLLEAYACNSSYTTGHVHDFAGCSLITQKYPSELQDVGTKFRGIFTKNLIDELGDLKYIILELNDANESQYYAIKTYKVTASNYTTHWEYSNDSGNSWINANDGYETELNINWFYNGADPTVFLYRLWANTTEGTEGYIEGNVTWQIDPVNNYPPLVDIRTPLSNSIISLPYNITFISSLDPNDDLLNVSLYLYQGGILNKTLVTDMNASNTSFYWNDSTQDGSYDLVLEACEINTIDLFCRNDTHGITIDNTGPIVFDLIPFANTTYYDNNSQLIEIAANVTDSAGVSNVLANITQPNGIIEQVTLTNVLGDKYNNSFVIPLISGRYNITFIATDNVGYINDTEKTYFNLVDVEVPKVTIIYPLNDTLNANADVAISLNITDSSSFTVTANVTTPNGTLYTLNNFSTGLQSDDFFSDTEGINWVHKNITFTGQTCITDINETVPGKMFLAVDGGSGPDTVQCAFNSLKRVDGNFDMNITFNITVFEDDTFFTLRSNSIDSLTGAGVRVFIVLIRQSGANEYRFGYNNGTTTTQQIVATDDTSGMLRIKRTNFTGTPVFNLYTLNNSNQEWINILGNISLPDSSRSQFIQIKPGSEASGFGKINMTVDDFLISGEGYVFDIFNYTSMDGQYNVSVYINDSEGYINDSETTTFHILGANTAPSRPFFNEPDVGDYIRELFNISWGQVIDTEGDSVQFNITLLNSDNSINTTIISNYGNIDTTFYQWNTSIHQDGEYSIRIKVFENETTERLSNTETLNGTFTIDNSKPNVIFNFQSPADIDNVNIITNLLNISYNISDNIALDSSEIKIYYKTNSSDSDYFIQRNGSIIDSSNYFNLTASSNISNVWYFTPNENNVYAATYNYDEDLMNSVNHTPYSLNSSSAYLKIRLFNVSNQKRYSFFEVYTDNQTENSNSLQVYYCNSSYVSGDPVLDSDCTNFYNLPASTPLNHSHNYSKHHVIPIAINVSAGMLEDVFVTDTSYFLLRGITGNDAWDVYYISNISREDTIQTSLDDGSSWSNFSGTVDAHLHQYNGTETFRYYICADDKSGNQNCSSERIDLLDLLGLPPTAPDVYNPVEGNYSGNITINYTASYSPNGYAISFYNISLVDLNETFVQTIITNNSLNLSYVWDSSLALNGEYFIRVEACDVQEQCSFGYSENITINYTLPYTSIFAIALNESAFDLDSSDYILESSFLFNTSLSYTEIVLMSSMNTFKLTGGGTNEIWVNITVNNEQIHEEKIRTVSKYSGQLDEGVTGIKPLVFNVSNGNHTLNFYFRRTGSGVVEINDIDFSLIELESKANNSIGESMEYVNVSFSNTALLEVFRFMVNRTVTSESFVTGKFNLNASGETNVTCRYNFPEINLTSAFFSRYIEDSTKTASTSLAAIEYISATDYNITLECLSSTGAAVTLEGIIVEFDLADNSSRQIGEFHAKNESTNFTNTITLGAGTHLLTNASYAFLNDGDSVFLTGGTSFYSTSGTYISTLIINSTLGNCSSKKERFLSDSGRSGNAFIYMTCKGNVTQDDVHNFSMYITIPTGETMVILDEYLLGFEAQSFDITELNTPPIVAIFSPLEDSNNSGEIVINWTTVDEQADSYTTNITISNSTNTTSIAYNLPNSISNYAWNTSTVTDGYWNLTVQSCENETSDLFCGNAIHQINIDNTVPSINQTSPLNNAVDVDGNITFNCSITDENNLNKVEFYFNDILNQTNNITGTSNQTYFELFNLKDGDYNWSCIAYDWINNSNQSTTYNLTVNISAAPSYNQSYFAGETTNWNSVPDITNVCNAILDNPDTDKIQWINCINAFDADFDSNVILGYNNITVLSENLNSTLNSSAILTFRNLTWEENPLAFINGELCPSSICSNISYNSSTGIAIFNVTQFSSYTTQGNAQLEIWDETDSFSFPYANQTKYENEQIKFFANYTKKNNDQSITGATCSINFDDLNGSMNYNNTLLVYEFNRSFSTNGTYDWNVTCDAAGFQELTTNDTVLINQSDTCTYSGSGNWNIDCADNCSISSNVNVLGNNISIIGTGIFTTTANITNWDDLFIQGTDSNNRCEVYCLDGGCFK